MGYQIDTAWKLFSATVTGLLEVDPDRGRGPTTSPHPVAGQLVVMIQLLGHLGGTFFAHGGASQEITWWEGRSNCVARHDVTTRRPRHPVNNPFKGTRYLLTTITFPTRDMYCIQLFVNAIGSCIRDCAPSRSWNRPILPYLMHAWPGGGRLVQMWWAKRAMQAITEGPTHTYIHNTHTRTRTHTQAHTTTTHLSMPRSTEPMAADPLSTTIVMPC